ncbi:spore germination protein GerPE [Paenibacillus arenilitoris]|uniref:Spore germination protein GerPE n=1 Tax=Paenibacillus arenilitoris TaxID=2772299 RepID=A0A927CLA3_9BACL|nr:spore germination protein GerPE [Paenibacillus arenilitoris]MBD2869520.1 spore germination protein GerPE [Paenibacillus arenilitoris]
MNNPYPIRESNIGSICIVSAASSAVVQVGDRGETNARLRALAVQRQEDHTRAGDVFFESYTIFSRDMPELTDPDYEEGRVIRLDRVNCSPRITVGCIHIIAAGSAASVLAGNGMRLTADSKIKHIRQYPRPRPYPPAGC